MAIQKSKGDGGEREICKMLNDIILPLLDKHGIERPDVDVVQRNKNQAAVGGNDLTNTFGLSIEVKRQEQLNINTWWNQCTEAAKRNNEHPVLLYRQNKRKWKCVTYLLAELPGELSFVQVRGEMSEDDFKAWFRNWVDKKLRKGETVRV